ncbi:hypothetical protein OCS_04895 [Ophiocordyceps sinensis CO18]|uniref:Uncharacterized protein n=1 Tax=Ophiocordyceps sinensis (strain Co18 / CGMCC 3.14243) TaxID=911162 RepID=T5AC36_OPHSC|nr:hypothetical protein OCS_04895 [Ophiocordyceps sinensis CO18]
MSAIHLPAGRSVVSQYGAYHRLERPSPEDILGSYNFPQEDLERGWVEYHEFGVNVSRHPYPEPTITEVCPYSIDFIIAPRALAVNGFEFAHLERRDDEYAYNYAASHPDGFCHMFSGEMRLLRCFLDRMEVYFRAGVVAVALTRARRLPPPPHQRRHGL